MEKKTQEIKKKKEEEVGAHNRADSKIKYVDHILDQKLHKLASA